jgi:hypothetical protein
MVQCNAFLSAIAQKELEALKVLYKMFTLTLYTPSAIWRIDDILGSPAHTLFSSRDK